MCISVYLHVERQPCESTLPEKGDWPFLPIHGEKENPLFPSDRGIRFARSRDDLEGLITPRTRRFAPAGYPYHVVNRGNERHRIFHEDTDYERFLRLLAGEKRRHPVRLYGLCLISNHVHFVIEPECDGALSTYVKCVLGGYACYLRKKTRTLGYGHVFKSRFWSDGIDDSRHFISALRYVEANPIRAHLCERAEDWRWSSLPLRRRDNLGLLDPCPYELPDDWTEIVNSPQSLAELEELRGRPIGRPRGTRRPNRET